MTTASGQFTRRVGLTVEVVCMLGLLSVYRGQVAFWNRLGLDPSVVLSFGLAVGFLLWLWGTLTLINARLQSTRRRKADE